jgi:predicted alpha/beta-hydrolase family hydrolase
MEISCPATRNSRCPLTEHLFGVAGPYDCVHDLRHPLGERPAAVAGLAVSDVIGE